MRVGIAGVSSVGKTTLAEAVAKKVGIPAILDRDYHEKCWAWLEQRGIMPRTKFFPEMTPEEHINFERAALVTRIEMEEEMKEFIGDETPLDFLNYFFHICAPHPEIMPAAEFEESAKKLWAQIEKYDLIWYVASGQIPIVDDNRRYTNEHLLTGYDFTLRGMIGNVIDMSKPIMGFLTNVPELEMRVKVVCSSIELLRQMEAERQLMN